MSPTPANPQTPAARFALIIKGLLRCVGVRVSLNMLTGGYPASGMARLPEPIAALIYARIQHAGAQFAALAERVRLRTARVYPNREPPRPRDDAPAPARPQHDPDAPRLPRGFGGVLGLLYWEAALQAEYLRQMLDDPETAALIRSSPGFARILRPLCRMLGVVPPDGLFPPRAPRKPRPRKASADSAGVATPDIGAPRTWFATWRPPRSEGRAAEGRGRVARGRRTSG